MRILFVDPGETTGWAVLQSDFSSDEKPHLIIAGESKGDDFPALLKNEIRKASHIDLVVYERFRIYKDTIGDRAVPVLKQIGAIEFVCNEVDLPFMQQPPSSKTFFLKKLKNLGMWQSGKVHANDAIAHGLFYCMTESQNRTGKTPSWVMLSVRHGDEQE